MSERVIYTIGRQFGSGGRLVGRQLAEKLSIPFYDRDLLEIAARDSGVPEKLFRAADEKASNNVLYSLMMEGFNNPMSDGTDNSLSDLPINDQLFLLQASTIKKLASQGSCVIVGRCAEYVLREDPDLISIFIKAPLSERAKRAVEVYGASRFRSEEVCEKNDKVRANYHNYYSDSKWGMCRAYTLTLDSSVIGIEGCVEAIIKYTELRDKKRAESQES